jgi:hypothetical protein
MTRSIGTSFILADGLTYGTGELAPRPDPAAPHGWRFDPPALDEDFLAHFGELLTRFSRASPGGRPALQLLPVLIDFHFLGPGFMPVQVPDLEVPGAMIPDPGWVKQGRGEAVTDPVRRARFLNEVLGPLLAVSDRHRGAIYAWELINEPEWITQGWHPGFLARPPVPEASMRAFLDEGSEHVRRAGFKPTIGFALAGTIRKSGIAAEVNQFHHYPGGSATLDPHTFDPGYPGIIGEFATAATDIWPELIATGQTTLDRLKLARTRGYPLALLWSFLARDRHTTWSEAVEHDVRAFTGERGVAAEHGTTFNGRNGGTWS